jgi:hypothetical protein
VRKPVQQQQQTEELTVAEEPVSPSGMLPRVVNFRKRKKIMTVFSKRGNILYLLLRYIKI